MAGRRAAAVVRGTEAALDAGREPPLVGLRRSSRFFPELESLRGIAVSLVLAFHVDTYVRFPFGEPVDQDSLLLAFVYAGHTGVDLFFLLSGFLLGLPFLAAAAGGRPVAVRDYFARRGLRILPLYWAAVAVGTVVTSAHARDLLRALPHLVFLSAVPAWAEAILPWGAVWWSLVTEVQFYLLLPLLLLLRWRAGRIVLGVALFAYAAAYLGLTRGMIRLSIVDQIALHNSVFGRGPLFLGGIGAAAIHLRWGERLRDGLARRRWLRFGGADLVLFGVLLAMGVFLRWLVSLGMGQQGYSTQWWHVVNAALWAAVLLLLLVAPLRTKRLFCNPVLDRLGVLSYSIYMIHAPLIFLTLQWSRSIWRGTFDGWTPTAWALIATLVAACLVLSELSYRFVERPFLVRKARFDG